MDEWAESQELQLITSTEGVTRDKKWAEDGLYSEKIFGKMYGDSTTHQCVCGKLHGRFNMGDFCKVCKSEVTRRDSIIKRFGAISFGEFYLISPFFYQMFQKIFGKTVLEKILAFEGKLDVDGNIEYLEQTGELNEFYGKGVEFFIDNFKKIYKAVRPLAVKKGHELYLELIDENYDKIFINFFPVFSHRLRPAIVVGERLSFDKMNNHYLQLISLSNTLQDTGESNKAINRIPLLFEMQQAVNVIYDRVIDTVSGKNGFIRSSLVGNRVNHSSRCVIVPLESGYAIDEVHLPYLACIELYKFHILNVLVATQGMSYIEALKEWYKATTRFSRRIYEIMRSLIERGTGARVLINRNPTISIGSILLMRLTHIKEDITDMTMSLSNNVLKFLGGDYDGDVLSIFLVLDEQFKKHFEMFNPKRFVLSPNDGHFNHFLSLDKDHMLGLTTLTI
jgi:DNA-directed RNA polymerase beta' subunit